MNGRSLLRLYNMCVMNSPVMFQSLNNQLALTNAEGKTSTIEIVEYLQFLDDLKLFVPITMQNNQGTSPQSTLCTIL